MLEQGGNAFDAAIAVAAALSVVEPYSSGMGGGGFWLLKRAGRTSTMLDAREKAPGNATADMYLNKAGNVNRDRATNTPLAAGIPGQAAAFAHLAEKYGELALKKSLAPAIRLAREGFEVGEHYRALAEWRVDVMRRYTATRSIFLENGRVPPKGHTLRQRALARTLERIAQKGRAGFYQGAVAQHLVREVQRAGGNWTLEDLRDYEVLEREPVVGDYRGARVIAAAPPSSGGIVLVSMLNMLETFDLAGMSEAQRKHIIIEAMRRAYRDRARYLGDSDFVDVPRDKLTSEGYAERLAANIKRNQATPSEALGPLVPQSRGGRDTSHFSVLDAEGNRVAATLSINLPFGSGFTVPGTGVLLNNEMDDFVAKVGSANAYGLVGTRANAIEPGKRPLSSMTPAFVEAGERVALLGTPGGSRIITMVLLATLEMMEGSPPGAWVKVARYHHQYRPDEVEYEPGGLSPKIRDQLSAMGHTLKSAGRRYGDMQAVLWNRAKGEVKAASDPRGQGLAETRKPDGSARNRGTDRRPPPPR